MQVQTRACVWGLCCAPCVLLLLTEVRELRKRDGKTPVGFYMRCLGWSMYHQGRAEGDRAAHVGWLLYAGKEMKGKKKKRKRGSEVKTELKCADGT